MNLKGMTKGALADYVAAQLGHFFPDGQNDLRASVTRDLDETLDRVQTCVNAVRMWKENEFDYLHSSQYCIFLYYLANTAWRNRQDQKFCTKLFLLNKALNGFDCFYDNALPDKFFIGHSVGIVLARTTLANYLVLYQNSTIGKNHGDAPVLGEGVVLYPNTAIIGKCRIGAGTVVAQGCSVINQDTPGDCYVFSQGDELVFKKPKRNVLADIFRL
jgi:serine O-acetyltransferase